ncbi:hypothetical protein GXW74_14050 [Roseomonas eburnea]|uniref:EF-hand domain-containing protein n=1 Tax=Neoroseomonas eburnea TaxID=1346889 RepID=A0A9X9XD29_9PROT|nr:hypothetical protein [Neoroseomonas eburnea]MBR0681615.1 hypothetical protein [Neoroseomonas eburnea]
MDRIEWVLVPGPAGRAIGAVGFIDGEAAVVVAFYEDQDGNRDGTVDWGEWLLARVSPVHVDGKAVLEVAMTARYLPAVAERGPGFDRWVGEQFVSFAGGLVVDAAYAVYFSQAIQALTGGIAGAIGGGLVREYVIRRGLEAAVHRVYDATVRDVVTAMPVRAAAL